MRDDTGIIKAGMAVVFSYGEYSDYGFGQVFICVKDFNYMEEGKKYYFECLEKEYSKLKNGERFYFWQDDVEQYFEDWLIRKGYLVLCQNREIHMGDDCFFDAYKWKESFLKEKGYKDPDEEEND